MRRFQKRQCIEAINLLEEAHGEIIRYAGEGHEEKAAALLEQCQQSAIGIGTLVETAGGEGIEAVRRLEEYCEIVYQFHERLCTGDPGDMRQLQTMLQKPLKEAEDCIRNRIRTRTEAVFLPYKASMWDSLESVWKAADEDPDCKAIVVPIPYYDKKPDGSLGEMHYEADLFPPDVPVMSYNAYDFEARHPDLVFIHNPYDNKNFVTSIHPFFFSENLKQYTDKLVYIPYFILEEPDPANQAAVSYIQQFSTLPAVVNSDYVIVQSEAVARIYVDGLVKCFGESQRSQWQKKILGLGSPKVDRVCNLRPEDLELPENWRKRIQREDGSRKKVIFYNTTLDAMLEKGDVLVDKMERVFRIFRENSEDVVLLWRPHPLMEETIATMRPQLAERYRRIVEEYKRAEWGIYDDSPDMYRAIAVSDGYYGDISSVVWLYQKTGKPIMLQNVDVN